MTRLPRCICEPHDPDWYSTSQYFTDSSFRGLVSRMRKPPTLLLVHGSWHGPWCWEGLTPELDRLGLPSATVALPSCGTDPAALGTVADDAAAVEAAIAD